MVKELGVVPNDEKLMGWTVYSLDTRYNEYKQALRSTYVENTGNLNSMFPKGRIWAHNSEEYNISSGFEKGFTNAVV